MALLMIASPLAPIKISHLRLPPTKIPNLRHRSASSGNRFSPPRCTLSHEPEPAPALASVNEGIIGLSVADRYGITVATDTRNPAAKWRTIGDNLIAYGDGDGACLKLYFDQLLHEFPDNHYVPFQSLMHFNKYDMPSREWTHHGSLTINVRNRIKTASIPNNLLRVEISNDHIKQEVTTDSLAAIGTGAPFAFDKLESVRPSIGCHHFGASEKTRRIVLSIAILKAMRSDEINCGLFSEIIRGTPFEEWKLVSRTPLDELLSTYGALPPETYVFNHPGSPIVDDSLTAQHLERLRMILKSSGDSACNIDSLRVWRHAD